MCLWRYNYSRKVFSKPFEQTILLMQSGFHHTTFAAIRLSSLFKNSCSGGFYFLGTIIDRTMKSSPVCNSVKPWKSAGAERRTPKGTKGECSNGGEQMIANNNAVQSQSWKTSEASYEEEFPSLSASISSKPKSKKRTMEKKLEEEAGKKSVHSASHHNNLGLPTSFGKKSVPSASKSPKLPQTHFEHGKGKRSSTLSQDSSIDEPFDICIPKISEHDVLKSSGSKKNRVMWVQKVQSTKENGQDRVDIVKINHTANSFEETGQVLRPGMVLFKHYIPISEQVNIVNRCRELGLGPGGFYRPGYKDGAKLRLFMMCLGLDWNPQTKTYGEIRQHDNVEPPGIPCEFTSLVCKVLDDSHTLINRHLKIINAEDMLPQMSPDVCIVNFYTTNGRLGLHKDRDESAESLLKGYPVVSISIGDSAEFLYGDQRDVNKAESILLESGDVLIFGGESRHIFHGVTNIIPKTAPPALLETAKLRPGRLNLTFRKY